MSDKVDDDTIRAALDGDHAHPLNRRDHKIIQKYLKKHKLEGVYTLDKETNEYVKSEPAENP